MHALSRLRPRSLRARLGIALGLLLVLAALNIGAFYWGARRRAGVFRELGVAITRHSALNEISADLENQYKRVKIVSDVIGVERAKLSREEHQRIIRALADLRARLSALAVVSSPGGEASGAAASDAVLGRLYDRAVKLTESWTTFYNAQRDDPAAAIAEVVMVAEPLAQELLSAGLPNAIALEHGRVVRASGAFVEADRLSSRLVWAILIASGALSIALAYSLSRQLWRAVASLKMGAERFGAGELAYRVKVDNLDELDEVGASLNMMAVRLRHAREDLELRNAELAAIAYRDGLTQLVNRVVFRERVELALSVKGRLPHEIAVLFIDLDNFKAVNDTFGHVSGDRLIVDVASRLLNATRGIDTVAWLGGDEFAILLDHVQVGKQARVVAERVISSLGSPFTVDGRIVHVTASIGVAWGHDQEGADELLRNADLAMYRAKARGKGRYEVFVPEMHAALLDRTKLEAELRAAAARNEFDVVFQPVVDLTTGDVVGFEALARWLHPERGEVAPVTFIPLAEDTGVIISIGQWLLELACSEAVSWGMGRRKGRGRGEGGDGSMAPGGEALSVSVNVSGRQLEDPAFITDVRRALEHSGLAPERLILEITETTIMRDSAAMLSRLNHLKALGVRRAMDDFGTGYSSLASLQRFPVDVIKIDKAFVEGVGKREHDAALMQAIITLSQALGLSTVAEGIELRRQHLLLRDLGCQLGQGYLFSRPLTASQARLLAAARRGGAGITMGEEPNEDDRPPDEVGEVSRVIAS